MSRRQKIAVVAVLAALALLYTGALAGGTGRGEGTAGTGPGGFVAWLGRLAGPPPAVARADLRADCLAGTTFTVRGTCTVRVAASDHGTRQLRLHAEDAVTVRARAPQGDTVVQSELDAGAEVKVTVDGKGGDLTLDCGGADSTCVVTLP